MCSNTAGASAYNMPTSLVLSQAPDQAALQAARSQAHEDSALLLRQAIALLVANRPVATSSDWSPPPPAIASPPA